jgi:phosphoglycerol transferase
MRQVDRTARALVAYVAAAMLSIAAAVLLLDLYDADLRVPFDYHGDALLYEFIVKSTLDHGWFWNNPSVGAPAGFQFYDFPASAHDGFHLLLIKTMSLLGDDWALLFNLYFLLGFPLITLSAMAVFRKFRVGYGPAIVGGILYAFLPSRLLKGEGHIFMDVFYQVPLAVMMLLWVCGDDPPLTRDRCCSTSCPRFDWSRPRSWGSLVVCALTASTSLYYAFFTTCLILAGGVWASIERRSMRNLLSGAALATTIVVGLAANGLPSIIYQSRHGPNHEVAERGSWEAEFYGMKLAQLLLPTESHRLPALRRLKERYSAHAPLIGENGATSLGVIGDVGFLVLLGAVLSMSHSKRRFEEPLRSLAALNIMAVLLGTIGGFGSLIALLVSPEIRTYSRINVLIAFFALFSVVLLLERFRRRHPRTGVCAAAVILIVGLLDQATPAAIRPYAATKREYASDADFVRRVEATVPSGTAILELPYVGFPESGSVERMGGYEPIRPYLHSHGVRWSHPTMSGRPGDAWLRDISRREPSQMVDTLAKAGFSGIVLDRDGYPDEGCGVEAAFRIVLNAKPFASPDGRLVFLSLSECVGGTCPTCGGPTQRCCAGDTCRSGLLCAGGVCECGRLGAGQRLGSGQAVASCDGRFSLTMQADGDLVLRGCGCKGDDGSCWRSASSGHPGAALAMSRNGNLVISAGTGVVDQGVWWSSDSAGHEGAFLSLQNDGNSCIFGSGCTGANGTCWCSNTCCR